MSENISNLDEVGISLWEDIKPIGVIVRKKNKNEYTIHKVNRNIKHITMANYITASGDTLTPMIISRIENFDKIWEKGYRPDENVMLRTRKPVYIDTSLFIKYVNVALIPFMDSIRENPLYSDEPAVLLIDNCSSHCSDEISQYTLQIYYKCWI